MKPSRPAWLSLLVLLLGCTSRSPSVIKNPVDSLVDSRPAIIFLPGFYGSALKDKTSGSRIFYSVLQALLGSSAMSLHQHNLGTPAGPELDVEGLLGTVPVIPALYEVDVYTSFIRLLRLNNGGSQVLTLAYDWRQDLHLAVQELDQLVKLLVERGSTDIAIVAHSMGGQIASYYLGYGSQPPENAHLNWDGAWHVKRVVFFGTPFMGSMIAFRSFLKGSGLPYSGRLLNADTMSSFPSLYQLLPSSATVLNNKGEPASLSLYDINVWRKHNFGLLHRTELSAGLISARDQFTEENLARAKRWLEMVQLGQSTLTPLPPSTLKVLNVVSSKTGTLDAAYFDEKTSRLLFDPKEVSSAGLKMDPLYKTGDGSVTLTSATVPAALEASTKVLMSELTHDQLFLDLGVEPEYNVFLSPPKK